MSYETEARYNRPHCRTFAGGSRRRTSHHLRRTTSTPVAISKPLPEAKLTDDTLPPLSFGDAKFVRQCRYKMHSYAPAKYEAAHPKREKLPGLRFSGSPASSSLLCRRVPGSGRS